MDLKPMVTQEASHGEERAELDNSIVLRAACNRHRSLDTSQRPHIDHQV